MTRADRLRTTTALALLGLSLLNMLGDALDLPKLKGLASLTAASPLPKVFSDVRGLETYASEFTLLIEEPGQPARDVPITPELYAKLSGAYNRRNVYGAALSYAPRLPEPLWQQVFCFALRPGGPLRREMQLPDHPETRIRVSLRTRTRGRSDAWILDPPCGK